MPTDRSSTGWPNSYPRTVEPSRVSKDLTFPRNRHHSEQRRPTAYAGGHRAWIVADFEVPAP